MTPHSPPCRTTQVKAEWTRRDRSTTTLPAGGGLFPLKNVTEQRCGARVGLPDRPSAPLPRVIFEPDRLSAALPQPNRAPLMVCRRIAEPPSDYQITLRLYAPRSSGCPTGMKQRCGDSFGLRNGTEQRCGGSVGLKEKVSDAVPWTTY
jgi:hypothetical protein